MPSLTAARPQQRRIIQGYSPEINLNMRRSSEVSMLRLIPGAWCGVTLFADRTLCVSPWARLDVHDFSIHDVHHCSSTS